MPPSSSSFLKDMVGCCCCASDVSSCLCSDGMYGMSAYRGMSEQAEVPLRDANPPTAHGRGSVTRH